MRRMGMDMFSGTMLNSMTMGRSKDQNDQVDAVSLFSLISSVL